MIWIRPLLLSLCSMAYLAGGVRAEAQATPIRDDTGMFHAAAIDRAQQRIADIHRKFDRNVFVRTVASASSQRWFPLLRTPQVNRMLEEQARNYADESGVPGIYVVICNRPRDVHVVVRPQDDGEFSRRDAEMLRRTLARSLHDKGADAALLAAMDQVQELLQQHAARGPAVVVNDLVLGGVLGGGLGLWLLLRMIRYRMRSEEAQARETPALFGAMFGCPAGLWIYDKLYPYSAAPPSGLAEVPPANPHLEPHEQHAEDRPWQGVGLG
ncbi:MAG: hypothetical protein ACYC3I_07575 [Gemmataceae bacterium]